MEIFMLNHYYDMLIKTSIIKNEKKIKIEL